MPEITRFERLSIWYRDACAPWMLVAIWAEITRSCDDEPELITIAAAAAQAAIAPAMASVIGRDRQRFGRLGGRSASGPAAFSSSASARALANTRSTSAFGARAWGTVVGSVSTTAWSSATSCWQVVQVARCSRYASGSSRAPRAYAAASTRCTQSRFGSRELMYRPPSREDDLQLLQAQAHASLDRPERRVEHRGYLGLRETTKIREFDDSSLL